MPSPTLSVSMFTSTQLTDRSGGDTWSLTGRAGIGSPYGYGNYGDGPYGGIKNKLWLGPDVPGTASVATANHLDPSSGAIAFRVMPTIETGVEEIWGEAGVKGAGTDHLRWGRDASKHPFCEWSSNDAAYQRLTASETLTAGTAYDVYLGHTGTVTSLAVDAGTLQTVTRAAVSGDFSTGDLTLEASAGGVIYQPFATFNRTLTAKEIATLNGKSNWTMKVLAGNPYRNFQLRPY